MCPAPNHRNIFREVVVSGIAIRMEISLESLQKFSGMHSTSAGLVLIHHNRIICISAGSVKPHIALALGLFSGLMEHLQCGFICMKNFFRQKLPVQLLIHRLQIILRCFQDPVREMVTVSRLLVSVCRRSAHRCRLSCTSLLHSGRCSGRPIHALPKVPVYSDRSLSVIRCP